MMTVAIVGRPNVGKSTLFNRLIGKRQAVVSPVRGTTRDRLVGRLEWRGRPLEVVDMGGVDPAAEGTLADAVRRQIDRGLQEADAILLVVDGQEGVVPADELLLERLRPLGKPIHLVVNKLEDRPVVPAEFHEMGLDEPVAVSALHGRGIGEMLDKVAASVPARDAAAPPAATPEVSIAIVGRQNVGKSSLLNRLLKDERVVINEVPGTTRDAIDTLATVNGRLVRLVDTAGLRHRRKVSEAVDFFAMGRTLEAIQRCDVAILLIDGSVGVTRDDRRIITRVVESGCGLILGVNKWDLAKGGKVATLPMVMRRALPQASYAPVIALSAKTGFQTHLVVPEAIRVGTAMRSSLTEEECTALIAGAWKKQPPSRNRGRLVKLKRAVWIAGRPVKILITTNPPGALLEPYRRYLLKFLHAQIRFVGVPLILTQDLDLDQRPSRGPKRRKPTLRRQA